ncbi:S41 family peptidase [Deinococcus malanensis]|uniref:S41 family peptidase n=1 Tax=Deinococcus malanensis TaxID=1706855 RepID=UPI0036307487
MVGSPAEKAGLQPGDRLTNLNDQGPPGTVEGLQKAEIFDDPPLLKVRVERGPVRRAQIRTLTLEPRVLRRMHLPLLYTPPDAPVGVQVLRIPSFKEGRRVGPRVHALVRQAQKQGTRKLIVDLRHGGGGLLQECLMAAGAIIGPAQVNSESRRGPSSAEWTGRRVQLQRDLIITRPWWHASSRSHVLAFPARWHGETVVLVDRGTASCHETMAYLLQRTGIPVLGLPTAGLLSTSVLWRELPGAEPFRSRCTGNWTAKENPCSTV